MGFASTLAAFVRRISKRNWQWLVIIALFPFWGIGALQLLVKSVHSIPSLCDYSCDLMEGNALISFGFAVTVLGIGLLSAVNLIWQHQAEKLVELEMLCRAAEQSVDPDYDSPPQPRERSALNHISYTRLWYMSFQNALSAKSGYDTMQLSPLKRWPKMLKRQLGEDLVPVWNLPLLLMALASIPLAALITAACDVLLRALTGFSYCQFCYQVDAGLAVGTSAVIFNFPIPTLILSFLLLAVFILPKLRRLLLAIKAAHNSIKAAESETAMNEVDPANSPTI
jgi:hypothetical protein